MSRRIHIALNIFLALLLASITTAFSAFDPVNDDTDIFLANPKTAAEAPNVLLMLDNTANWNQPFANEKAALVQVINSLQDGQFNVGLGMMVETGGGNDTVDGAYIRYHVSPMQGTAKTKLSTLINDWDILNDKSNNNMTGLALYESYLYYAGLKSYASWGKVKTDRNGTTEPYLAGLPAPRALVDNPSTANSFYTSPVKDGCQKNFVIYISNGQANENASARATLEGKLGPLYTAAGKTLTQLDVSNYGPTGQQENWGDEMAKYMAENDIIPDDNTSDATKKRTLGKQTVITYVLEINPQASGLGPDMTALLQSTAINGKGKYFFADGNSGTSAIIDALNKIFAEIQAVNSVFASTTLPVSVNVRGTNLNQVYIGVFRPDEKKSPRWLGNLKMYKLALVANSPTLVDVNNTPAQNTQTGFLAPAAQSFWTSASDFWQFRTQDENGFGGISDAPDGPLVEKGAVAQQIRIAYATDQSNRSIYTCTTGCDPGGTSLSGTPFNTSNTAITAELLNLDKRLVAPLTGYDAKSVTALTDRRTVALSNVASPLTVTAITNGSTTKQISTLRTAVPQTITSLTGIGTTSGSVTATIASVTRDAGTGNPPYTVTVSGATLPGSLSGAVTFACTAGTNYADINNASAANRTVTTGSVTSTTFKIPGPNGADRSCTAGTITYTTTVSSNTTTATAVVTGHGYSSGDSVTIANSVPTTFNGTYNITKIDNNTFTYTMSGTAGAATTLGTATGSTTTATATFSAAHGFANNSSVTIYGASPTDYNGTYSINATGGAPVTFTYTILVKAAPNTASPVYAVQGGSKQVTVTAAGHGLTTPGQAVVINGAPIAEYNGSFTIDSVVDANTFTYTPDATKVLPEIPTPFTGITMSGSTSATVTATLANHGFANNASITIEAKGTDASGHTAGNPYTITYVDANTFTYSTGTAKSAPDNTGYTVRLASTNTAYATVTGHGLGAAGTTISGALVEGAAKNAYNGVFNATVLDANTITYPIASAPGADTSTSITFSIKTTTARATSVNHSLGATGSTTTVKIEGASPADFNSAAVTVTITGPNSFTYTIPTGVAQGNATGSIIATPSAATDLTSERNKLIDWVRGQDNFADENKNSSTTDIRASVHGDVLHSRPAVINYNRYGTDNDVYVFYGANDGIFRAVKGGTAAEATSAPNNIAPGKEVWGFIPPEFFSKLNRLRTAAPVIGSSFKKPYFADGSIGVYSKDTNNNGKLGDVGDVVNLYISMHRGGRLIYALDVNNPHDPKFLWKIDNTVAGFAELGQTWSQPTVVTGLAGYTNPVLIFGGGYDEAVEDVTPSAITASDATTVTTASGSITRTMGRAIYMVDALDGTLLWRGVGANSRGGSAGTADATTAFTKEVTGMDYAIPSDITVIRNESGGFTNRAYVGDTGGNMWRVDFRFDNSHAAGEKFKDTLVTKIAAVGGSDAAKRKFLFPPDVVGARESGYDAILIGSGDREHPFDELVENRFYSFRDRGSDAGPLTGTDVSNPAITESAMFNATTNCIQDALACPGITNASTQKEKDDAQELARDALLASSGWYVTLRSGEKVVGSAISLAKVTFFNTNQPKNAADIAVGTCASDLGIARQYVVGSLDATIPINEQGNTISQTRDSEYGEGGYLPSPVHVVVTLDGKPVEAVISGVAVQKPFATPLNSRLRKYWYKDID